MVDQTLHLESSNECLGNALAIIGADRVYFAPDGIRTDPHSVRRQVTFLHLMQNLACH